MKRERMEIMCKRMMIVGAIGYVVSRIINDTDITVTINDIKIINNGGNK